MIIESINRVQDNDAITLNKSLYKIKLFIIKLTMQYKRLFKFNWALEYQTSS